MLTLVGDSISILTAGDSWTLVFNDPDHPTPDWTANIAFSRNGSLLLQKVGVVVGENFQFEITLAESATITAGDTQVYIIFSGLGGVRKTEYAGSVLIVPAATSIMPPTPSQEALIAVLATITKVLSQPEASATFNGQTFTMHNIQTLYDIRDRLITSVNSELRALGLTKKGSARNILTRFR